MGSQQAMSAKKRILVVDDEINVVKSLTFVLSKEGYDVSSAADGEEAMAKIKELKPDLVFLDIMMPKKNGYEVCTEMRSDPGLSGIYVIMLTAKSQEVDKGKGLNAGADEFIVKPFSPLRVVERVKELLG